MPAHNPLVSGPINQRRESAMSNGSGNILSGRGIAVGVGPVHLTIIGLVIAAVAGLVLLDKVGFRFSTTVGGR